MKKIWKGGPLLIVIAACLWAFDGIIRRNLYVLPPIVIVFFEHFVGSILLAPIVLRGFKKEKLSVKEWGAIAVVSLFSGLLGTLWFTSALLMTSYISFSVVFLLQKLQPVFAIISARIILKEKLSKHYLLWAILALIAAYFITFPKGYVNLNTGNKTVIAALFALGSAAAWGSTTAFSRYTLLQHDDKYITGLRFWVTTIFALIGVFIMSQQAKLYTVTWAQFGQFALIAFSTGMVGLLIYYKGLKETPVRVSTILELTFPFLAVVIDVVLYKSVLVPIQVVAAVILLFVMYKISQLKKI